MDVLNLEKLQLFLVIVLPGFVAIKVFDLFSPPVIRDFGASVVEAVVYGLLNFALWAWYLVGVTVDGAKERPALHSFMFFVVCVLSPAILAFAASKLRRQKWVCRVLGESTPSAWDDFFNRKQECWVICHLKSGKKIAGLYSARSFATTYPQKAELYIEKTYYVDENGKIQGEVPDSFGMLVRYEDCYLIEFLKVERPDA